jgi:hypothetical protein
VRVPDAAETALSTWEAWVAEIEDYALDEFEYEALLESRGVLAERLEMAGRESLFDQADAIDCRFRDATIEVADSPFAWRSRVGWWWSRLPASEDFRRYVLGDY